MQQIGVGITKLFDRSVKMVMIGYEEGTKGYRMLNPVSRTLHISRDVIFEEDQVWDWTGPTAVHNIPEYFEVELPATVEDPTIGNEANSEPGSPPAGSPEPGSPQATSQGSLGSNSPHTPQATSSDASSIDWVTPIQG